MGSVFSAIFGGGATTADQSPSEPSPVMVFHPSNRWHLHFNSSKESPKLIVFDFSAPWCGPCKFMELAVHAMASKFPEVKFVKIDVDELTKLFEQLRGGI